MQLKYLILLQIYFAINLFLAGFWFNEKDTWDGRRSAILSSIVCIFFGILIYLGVFIFDKALPIIGWINAEIKFQYRFRFTNYWDKILLDDSYSPIYKTREEKLKRMEEMRTGKSKQSDRHAKLVIKKYENK